VKPPSQQVTNTLQTRGIKMLLCCRDSTLAKKGVQEKIGIAGDLVQELNDPKFIIPLRLEPYKKLFGIGELQWVDFVRGWAEGLVNLLDTLRRQKVPQIASKIQINPNWEIYRRRGAISINNEPERLTSNWDTRRRKPPMSSATSSRRALSKAMQSKMLPRRAISGGTPPPGFLLATVAEINDAFAYRQI
jgi:hypothetical protein